MLVMFERGGGGACEHWNPRMASITPAQERSDRVRQLTAVAEDIDLRQILRVLNRRKVMILGLLALTTALAGLIAFQLTPLYTADRKSVV